MREGVFFDVRRLTCWWFKRMELFVLPEMCLRGFLEYGKASHKWFGHCWQLEGSCSRFWLVPFIAVYIILFECDFILDVNVMIVQNYSKTSTDVLFASREVWRFQISRSLTWREPRIRQRGSNGDQHDLQRGGLWAHSKIDLSKVWNHGCLGKSNHFEMCCHTKPTWGKFIVYRLLWCIQNRSADPALWKAKMQFRTHHTQRPAGWWFQPSWKIWVNLDHMPSWGENSKCTFDVVLIFKYQQLWVHGMVSHVFFPEHNASLFRLWDRKKCDLRPGRCSAVFRYEWIFKIAPSGYDDSPGSITSSLKNLQLKWARTCYVRREIDANHPHLVAHFARHLVGKIREHDCHCSFAHH